MGGHGGQALDRSDAACRAYFARTLRTGKFRCWVAVTSAGQVVASGGVVVNRHPPAPANADGRIAYITNMSTDPAFRRRGLARLILAEIMAWVQAQGITAAALHATGNERWLYKSFGFTESPEMLCGPDDCSEDVACVGAGSC